jgi:RNA polymerase sigma-70 factor, ECF subfamily
MSVDLTAELALVRAAAGGDQDAFRTLWTEAERPAYALCVRLTGNHADAADALQEAQLAAWRNLHRFQARCPFGAWVYAIARNAALAVVRARSKRSEVELDTAEDDGPRPTGFADTIVESIAVREALETIPGKHREALLLWVGGLSYDQVAGLMEAPTNSVRVWIHRARSALRERLAEQAS